VATLRLPGCAGVAPSVKSEPDRAEHKAPHKKQRRGQDDLKHIVHDVIPYPLEGVCCFVRQIAPTLETQGRGSRQIGGAAASR
jgi:hypothetical protein